MNNTTTNKSIRFLTQPLPLIALIIYAINELILQRFYPSWISGKLSDFAWLFIAPVILTLILSVIFPNQWQKKANAVPLLAYFLIALCFIGIKTIPVMNHFVLHSWHVIFHQSAAIRMDIMDLFALSVLPLSWMLWQNKEITAGKRMHQSAVVISIFTLLTLADASAPISGVSNLVSQPDRIIAETNFQGRYFSQDGGLSWTNCESSNCLSTSADSQNEKQISIPDTTRQYRITDSGGIEVSQNDGASWERVYANKSFSNASEYYQLQTRPNAVTMNPGAQDVLYDPISGNVLFAMGLQGVLIVEPDGHIIQAGIGENLPTNLADPMVIISILFPFLLLSLAVILIFYASIIIFSGKRSNKIRSMLALLAWGYLTIVFPEVFSGYNIIIGFPLLLVVLSLIGWILFYAYKERKMMEVDKKLNQRGLLLKTIPGGLAFFLCYILWYLNVIPSLKLATIISFAIVLAWFIFCVTLSYRLKKN